MAAYLIDNFNRFELVADARYQLNKKIIPKIPEVNLFLWIYSIIIVKYTKLNITDILYLEFCASLSLFSWNSLIFSEFSPFLAKTYSLSTDQIYDEKETFEQSILIIWKKIHIPLGKKSIDICPLNICIVNFCIDSIFCNFYRCFSANAFDIFMSSIFINCSSGYW